MNNKWLYVVNRVSLLMRQFARLVILFNALVKIGLFR